MPLSEETRAALIAQYGFYAEALRYQERAGFRCEYCSADLLASVDVFERYWERDHIVPTGKGGPDNLGNWANSCHPCNQLKGKWDPRDEAGPGADRGALVAAARRYVQRRRAEA